MQHTVLKVAVGATFLAQEINRGDLEIEGSVDAGKREISGNETLIRLQRAKQPCVPILKK